MSHSFRGLIASASAAWAGVNSNTVFAGELLSMIAPFPRPCGLAGKGVFNGCCVEQESVARFQARDAVSLGLPAKPLLGNA